MSASPSPPYDVALMWFRRDLRLTDNAALHHALKAAKRVVPCFVFDTDVLTDCRVATKPFDRRVDFIHRSLQEMKQVLHKEYESDIYVGVGSPKDVIVQLVQQHGASAVFINRDYEPAAVRRDRAVGAALQLLGAELLSFKDHVIFEAGEVQRKSRARRAIGKEETERIGEEPFRQFAAYNRQWTHQVRCSGCPEWDCSAGNGPLGHFLACSLQEMPSLKTIGFESTDVGNVVDVGVSGAQRAWHRWVPHLCRYHEQRDELGGSGVSRLSVHFRFGTMSVREAVRYALSHSGAGSEAWLREIGWRDYYQQKLSCYAPSLEIERASIVSGRKGALPMLVRW